MIIEDIFFLFFFETICCDLSSELSECFYIGLTKSIPYYHQILPLIKSSVRVYPSIMPNVSIHCQLR